MLKLLAWLFVVYLLLSLLMVVLGLVAAVFLIWLLIRLMDWLIRWAVARHQAKVAARPLPLPPLTERERMLRDVERIIGFRGEARFIREMDERLGNPPDPRYQER